MLKSLSTSKGIKKEKRFLAAGQHLLAEVEASGLWFESIHFDEEKSPDYLLSKELFKELSNIKLNEPIYLLKTPELKQTDLTSSPTGIEVLLPVGDPKNIGALIRTCRAFSVSKIVLLEEAANPFLPDSVKASSGAILNAPLEKGPSIKSLEDIDLYTLDKNGIPLKESSLQGKPLRLLIGEEGGNLPEALYKKSLSIPISRDVESLNVNSCLSIALYELSR